jgi:single-strand DNA-binding protein
MENKINKIIGTIHHIGSTQRISDKFQKREFVIQTDEKFPQKIMMQLTNDKCDVIENLQFGELIECCYNLRGREWISPTTGEIKWFNTIECWSVQFANATAKQNFADRTQSEMNTKQSMPVNEQKPEPKPESSTIFFGNADDDLPF